MTRTVESGLAGLVLAGGRSSRMGEEKAAIHWRGQTLLDHACALLQRVGCERIHVLGRPEQPGGIADAERFAGPARALLGAVNRLHQDTRRLVVVPVDMPCLQVEDVTRLLDEPGVQACFYRDHPVPFVAGVESLSLVPAQTRSLKTLLSAAGASSMDIPDGRRHAFANINTPADIAGLAP